MDDVLQRAPTLAAQRSTVKARVQSCTLAHLASWHAERPPPLPLEAPDARRLRAQRAGWLLLWHVDAAVNPMHTPGVQVL